MNTVKHVAHIVVHGVRCLPMRFVLLLLWFYQKCISPMRPATCKYYPSCSQYAVIAIRRHGLLRGSALAGWRLLRCNPWSRGGVDDVPPARERHTHHRPAAARRRTPIPQGASSR